MPETLMDTWGKTLREVCEELRPVVGQDPELEHFAVEVLTDGDAFFPESGFIACYAVAGGSEGHWVHVDAIRGQTAQPLFRAKTFGGLDHAIGIASRLTRALIR